MTSELARRIAITIGALLIFRLSLHIPLPGLAPPVSQDYLREHASFLVRVLSGPNLTPIGVLVLTPYISAAIIIQLVAMVWRRFGSLERSGEAGRRMIARYTLILALLLATFQAFGVASSLQNIHGAVDNPGGWFVLSATASMVGGVFFLIWLSELITRHGIGNGLALIISVVILVSLPHEIAVIMELVRQGALSANVALFHAMFWVVLVALMVFVESARRNVRIEFAERKVGERVFPAQSAVLPIKINSAGLLVPVTVAPWFWSLPLTFAAVIFGNGPLLHAAYNHMVFGNPAHLVVSAVAIFILAFVYTSYVLDPERVAEQLGKRGGTIPGVEPGEPTADHLDRVASLTTVIGAVYLTALSLIPEVFLAVGHELPYKIGGGSVLIVVCTILDIQKQVRDVSLTGKGGGHR
jgi:preprotein translocase subunit SecY